MNHKLTKLVGFPTSRRMHLLRIRAPHLLFRLSAMLFAVIFVLLANKASAVEPPFSRKVAAYAAEGTPLVNFLLDLMSSQGVPAVVSEAVGGMGAKVNGKFRQTPQTVLDEVCRQFGLQWYYDGNAVHIHRASESASQMLWIDRGDFRRIAQFAKDLGVIDSRYVFKGSDTDPYVMIAGHRRYVERMTEIVEFVAASPLKQARPLEFKVFKLKHARAADSSINVGGSAMAIPGIASLVNRIASQMQPGEINKVNGVGPNYMGRIEGLSGKGLATRKQESSKENKTLLERFGGKDQTPDKSDDRSGNTRGSSSEANAQREAAYRASSVSVIAEPRINAVLVRDDASKMSLYQSLIEALDVPTALFDIEATIIDVDSSKLEQLGVEIRLHGGSKLDALAIPGASGSGLGFTDNPSTPAQGTFSLTALAGSAQR
ncbi:MAG: secretin N-terminal domain-containing protein, partial [Casimicrobium sp.]